MLYTLIGTSQMLLVYITGLKEVVTKLVLIKTIHHVALSLKEHIS